MLKNSELTSIKRYLKKLEGVNASKPHTKSLTVYSVSDVPFAYLESGKQLLRLSLRSDPGLSALLRGKYEEVLPGQQLDTRKWITIIISGQLSTTEITALIDHSYQIALGEGQL